MAVTSNRSQTITYTGDVEGTQTVEAAENSASPGSVEIKTLSSGFNQISVPTGGATVTACTILPPSGNTAAITLKGVTGDTGIRIHNTDPTTIAIHSDVTSFGLTTSTTVTGVRLYWS
jgi:hypothetical protein